MGKTNGATGHSDEGPIADHKGVVGYDEKIHEETAHEAAERGHVATDK
jgi:hypothetical protein